MCPNNLFLLWMVTEVFRLSALFGAASQIEAIEVFVVLNCLSWAIATWCAYKALREISSPLCAIAGWGVCVLLLWTSPWTGIVYTDSVTLAVPSATVYLYLRSLRASVSGRCGLWAALGVVSILGYLLKPQTVFPLFAIVALELIRTAVIALRAARGRLRRPRAALGVRAGTYAGLGAGIALTLALTASVVGSLPITRDESRQFGPQHFLMMGMNPSSKGGFSADDVYFSSDQLDREARARADLEVARDRISAMGPLGFIGQLLNKAMTNLNDGTFAWSLEGEFFKHAISEGEGPLGGFSKSLYYEGGANWSAWRTYEQGIWITVLVFCPLVVGLMSPHGRTDAARRRRSIAIATVTLSLLMLLAFELLFEARARYLYSSAPLFIMMGALGMGRARMLLERRLKRSRAARRA